MDINDCFRHDYQRARFRFLAACREKGRSTETFLHPLSAAADVELACDVAYIGEEGANKLLILSSGLHGPELMSGSGCQTGLLMEDRFAGIPGDSGVLFIHALNPWGAHHLRRNTEDNVDLARNFVDFSKPLPVNPDYERIHHLFSEETYSGFCDTLSGYMSDEENREFVDALMRGQYAYPEGFGYGGNAATWSNELFCRLLLKYGGNARKVCHVDYHSGLGPYGYGMAVCMHTGERLRAAREVFGRWLVAPRERECDPERQQHPATGHPSDGLSALLANGSPDSDRDIVSIVLEFGTSDSQDVNLRALVDDHWLTYHGDVDSELGKDIKSRVLESHFPDDPEWRASVWFRSEQVIRQALAGLVGK
ncbi:MAG: DUF2817 domain-containing protein [Gammaproteobacteria bacterium]|nr:DUF2817 domain-containing protein [Gammaproteobacteria bacterium]